MEQNAFAPAGAEAGSMDLRELYKTSPERYIDMWHRRLESMGQDSLLELINRVERELGFTLQERVAVMIGLSYLPWPNVPHLDVTDLNRPLGQAPKTLFADSLGLHNMIEFEIRITTFLNYNQISRARVRALLSRILRAAGHIN